jgi:hypothetical protein
MIGISSIQVVILQRKPLPLVHYSKESQYAYLFPLDSMYQCRFFSKQMYDMHVFQMDVRCRIFPSGRR